MLNFCAKSLSHNAPSGIKFDPELTSFGWSKPNAAFTHACLTTRYRTKSFYKSIFGLSRSRDI